MVIPPVRIHDEVDLDSHEYVFKVRGTEVARGRIMAGHKLAMDPGDAVGNLSGHPHHRARLRAAGRLDRRRPARRGRGARLHGGRRRVGDRHPPDRDDPRARRPAAHPPGRAPAARPAQGVQRGGGQRGRARTSCRWARSSACCRPCWRRRSRSATSARSSSRSATRPASPATRRLLAEYARQALGRAITAPAPRRRPHAAGDHARSRRSSRRSPPRSPRPPTASTWRWSPPAPRRCSAAVRGQSEHAAARGGTPRRCCCARRACAATCGAWSRPSVPHLAVCSYNEIARRHQRRDHRSDQRMSTTASQPDRAATDPLPGCARTAGAPSRS